MDSCDCLSFHILFDSLSKLSPVDIETKCKQGLIIYSIGNGLTMVYFSRKGESFEVVESW